MSRVLLPPYGLNDYQAAYDRLFNIAAKSSKLLIFGQFGVVESPPISDLDVFVCFKDEGFAKSKEELLESIERDRELKYLCWHAPLILPQSMLGTMEYLHSLYGLRFVYNALGYEKLLLERGYCEFLNVIWATFLIPIVFGQTMVAKRVDARSMLLLLKNVHQAINNLGGDNDVMNRSVSIREGYLAGNISVGDIVSELENAGVLMLSLLARKEIPDLAISEGQPVMTSFRLGRSINYHQAESSAVLKVGNVVQVSFTSNLWRFFLSLMEPIESQPEGCLKTYLIRANKASSISRHLRSDYPFISPFGFPIHRRGIGFYLRKFAGCLF